MCGGGGVGVKCKFSMRRICLGCGDADMVLQNPVFVGLCL